MTDQSNAVAVFDPIQAARELSREVRKKSTGIAALLGVDVDAADPKEAAKAKALLDRFVTVALHAASDPSIRRATRESLIQSIRDSALLGLEPVGSTGDGAIVVYDERVRVERPSTRRDAPPGAMIIVEEKVPTAHFQPMYRGLLKLARRSEQIAHVDAHVVYQGDEINLDLGSQPSVKHFPVLDGAKRGNAIGAYAVAELVNGRRYVEWMTTADIEEVRKSSRGNAAPESPWVKFWAEMARKTVLRRLMKRLPLETMAEHALRIENEAESRPVAVAATAIEGGGVESSARRRLRSRFGRSDEDEGANAPSAPPAGTPTAGAGQPAVSVDPRASEPPVDPAGAPDPGPAASEAPRAVAGEVVEDQAPTSEICGATTDPALGDVETCTLAPSHGGTLHVATSPDGTILAKWPNR